MSTEGEYEFSAYTSAEPSTVKKKIRQCVLEWFDSS